MLLKKLLKSLSSTDFIIFSNFEKCETEFPGIDKLMNFIYVEKLFTINVDSILLNRISMLSN